MPARLTTAPDMRSVVGEVDADDVVRSRGRGRPASAACRPATRRARRARLTKPSASISPTRSETVTRVRPLMRARSARLAGPSRKSCWSSSERWWRRASSWSSLPRGRSWRPTGVCGVTLVSSAHLHIPRQASPAPGRRLVQSSGGGPATFRRSGTWVAHRPPARRRTTRSRAVAQPHCAGPERGWRTARGTTVSRGARPSCPSTRRAASRRRGPSRASASSWCGVGVGDVREVASRAGPSACEVAQPGQQVGRERRPSPRRSRVKAIVVSSAHPLVGLGQRQELGVLRRAEVGDHQRAAAGAAPAARRPARARCAASPTGPEPACSTTGRAGVRERAPRLVEQRVARGRSPRPARAP